MLQSQPQVACKLDLDLHEADVLVRFESPLLENLAEFGVISTALANKDHFVCRAVLIIDAVELLPEVFASVDVDALDKLNVEKAKFHLNVVLHAVVLRVQALELSVVLLDGGKELGLSHFLQNFDVVLAQRSHKLTVRIQEHGVLLVVVIEQCPFQVPSFDKVETRLLSPDISALIKQMSLGIL